MRVRLREGGVLRRVAAGTGVSEVREVERLLDEVAAAVAENAALEAPLAARVAGLEQALVGRLEVHHRQALEKQGLRHATDRPAPGQDPDAPV